MQHATALLERLRGAHTDNRVHADLVEVLAATLAYVRAPDEEGRARVLDTIELAHDGWEAPRTPEQAVAPNRWGETPFGVLQQVLPALAAVLPPDEERIRRALHGLLDALIWGVTDYVIVETANATRYAEPQRPRWSDPARVARALREGAVNILKRHQWDRPGHRYLYEVLDACECAAVRDALAYSVLEHFVRRMPAWVHVQAAHAVHIAYTYEILGTIHCVIALRLHHAGETLLPMLVALGAEVDAWVQAEPQRAGLRHLQETLHDGEAYLRRKLEARWLAVRMALHPRLGARSPARVVGDDGLMEAMMRGSLEGPRP